MEISAMEPEDRVVVSTRPSRREASQTATHLSDGVNSELYACAALKSNEHIRVLHLHPGEGDEPLFCSVHEVDLGANPEYEALSYVWGTPDFKHQLNIHLNHHFTITSSLNNALRDLRHANIDAGPRILWVDACCIDQSNIPERNQQVQMMGRIYRQASRVISYIGPEADESNLGLEFASRLYNLAMSFLGKPREAGFSFELDNLAARGLPHREAIEWKAVRRLLRRPNASRVWILQEYVLNQNVVMMCGTKTFPCELLPRIYAFHKMGMTPRIAVTDLRDEDAAGNDNKTLLNLASMASLRLKRLDGTAETMSLAKVLIKCHGLDSTDPRDKVYGILGLASDADNIGIRVDYSISVTDLYINTAIHVLETCQNFELLSCSLSNPKLTLPSWVPDWSTSPVAYCNIARDLFNAHASTPASITINKEEQKLLTKGVLLDELIYVSNEIFPSMGAQPGRPTLWPGQPFNWILTHLSVVHRLREHPYGDSITDAFWRTLITDQTHLSSRADQTYAYNFQAAIRVCCLNYALSMGIPRGYSDRDMLELADYASLGEDFDWEINDDRAIFGHDYLSMFQNMAGHRSFAITKNGFMALVPSVCDAGDVVAVFGGGNVPFVLRGTGEEGQFKMIGESFVHGIMDGWVFENDPQITNFTLV
ncbi:heterokaryon incompatibility protein-domain-containing protein [Leptodontidium sp. MPI-SDFR-AT-0119]|nr:heterokaryon incompatibility protein-domain-containing protein [Leptodontidium sp. MPI-SDFR-AT-0119]